MQLVRSARDRAGEQDHLLLLELGYLALRIERYVDEIAQRFADRDIAREQRLGLCLDIKAREAGREVGRAFGLKGRLVLDPRLQDQRRALGQRDQIGIGRR